ncbi:MAG: phosphatase PAP2 family protein [Saprospiraceae bacterium]|nr:phosphatase PAP2 family protein [Saprospiraceae bacterium]
MSLRLLIFFISLLLSVQWGFGQKSTVETSGDILQIALPATAALSTLIYKDGSKPALQFSKSFLVAVGTTHILKRVINRTRPNGGDHSFPSGHTAAAFTGAAFIHKRYGIEYGIPAYLIAAYTGWTRVDSNKHYWTDILGGAAIGVVSAFVFTQQYNPKLVVSPIIGTEQVMLNLQLRF